MRPILKTCPHCGAIYTYNPRNRDFGEVYMLNDVDLVKTDKNKIAQDDFYRPYSLF